MKKEIFAGLVLLIAGGLFTKYKFFDDKIELKYSLSQKIDADFLSNKEDFGIQQLTVKNSGDLEVDNIVIKINSKVQDFRVKKFKFKDSISSIKSNSSFELEYPKLPPMGDIIVLIKSGGIENNNIEIYHNKGKAIEVFENKSSYESYASIMLILFYMIITAIGLRNILISTLESKASYRPEETLKSKQPWYIDNKNWYKIREIAISRFFKPEFNQKIENSNYYKFLNRHDLDFLTDEENKKLNENAINSLKNKIGDKLFSSYFGKENVELILLTKPDSVSDFEWKNIINRLSNLYFTQILLEIFDSKVDLYNDQIVIKYLESDKIELLVNNDKTKLKKILSNYYQVLILIEFIKYNGLANENIKWDLISDDNNRDLNAIFSKFNKSIKDKDYYSEITSILIHSLKFSHLESKPDNVNLEDWTAIKEIFELRKKADNDLKEALAIRDDFFTIKEKVNKQLIIINNILKDPNSITTIEDYDIPFEKGNWKNLQKIAEILNK